MVIKIGFVSNSSSCSFTITNKTSRPLTLRNFVEENPQLIHEYIDEYGITNNHIVRQGMTDDEIMSVKAKSLLEGNYIRILTQDELIESAKENNCALLPGDNLCIFGDEQGTLIGEVFDYILRDGGSSNSFAWRLEEMLR